MRFPKNKRSLSFLLVSILIAAGFSGYAFASRDRTAPTAPAALKVAAAASTSISLVWNEATDNVEVTEYYIYRDGAFIGKTVETSYTSTGTEAGKTYKFHVKARDAAGNLSAADNGIAVTTKQITVTPAAATPKKVVGYFAAWAAYSGFTPDKLDVSKLTHINYSFANISSDYKIAMGYPDVDPANFNKLNALKQINPALKTLISVGGWSWSGRFSDAALTDASRTAFADSCVDFIVKYGFDGIDIDWEYPVSGGLDTNIRRPEDKHNFTLLLKKLREKLDARTLIDGKKYLLTIAGASGTWYIDNTELGALHQYIDYANIMTYDIHGTWDAYTDFNAPLYNNTDNSGQYKWSVDQSVNAWLNTGLPASKLVMGVPFYGNKYNYGGKNNNGLYQSFSGGNSVSYATIASNYLNAAGYVRYFHQQSKVPWLFNGFTFISYDDAQSIGLKVQYAKDKNLGGAAIWELSQDPDRVLLTSLYNGLNKN